MEKIYKWTAIIIVVVSGYIALHAIYTELTYMPTDTSDLKIPTKASQMQDPPYWAVPDGHKDVKG